MSFSEDVSRCHGFTKSFDKGGKAQSVPSNFLTMGLSSSHHEGVVGMSWSCDGATLSSISIIASGRFLFLA